jgi:divalent metal cation (Fe/Co/Zn/Cd) transporter
MGFDYYIDIHVVVDGNISVKQWHDIAHEVKKNLLSNIPKVKGANVHIEPFDPDHDKT